LAQLGVRHVCFDPPGNPHNWTLDDLKRQRDKMEAVGLILDMVQLPLSSRPIEEQHSPDILSTGPNRDKQIDSICRLIERVHEVGIPAVKYNLNIIGIPRSEYETGRSGSKNSTFRWAKMDQNASPGSRASSPRTRTGSGSTISSSASFRWRRRTRFVSPAIRTTRTRRRATAA